MNAADEGQRGPTPDAALTAPSTDTTPDIVDGIAFARLYGEPLFKLPQDLYIPPDALEVFLETFEGPLDLEERARQQAARVKQTSYVYYQNF